MNAFALSFLFWVGFQQALCDPLAHLPPLSDLARFPGRDEAMQAADFGAAHVAWLEERQKEQNLIEFWADWKREADRCLLAWKCLCYVTNGDTREEYRRTKLEQLRNMLGSEDYDLGRMPPAAPFWRFRRLP